MTSDPISAASTLRTEIYTTDRDTNPGNRKSQPIYLVDETGEEMKHILVNVVDRSKSSQDVTHEAPEVHECDGKKHTTEQCPYKA